MAEVEATKALSGLLNGIAQKEFYYNSDVTEQLLRTELFPEMPQEEFTTLHSKMRSLLKVPHHRHDGTTSDRKHCFTVLSIATADMDHAQLEAFLTAQTRRQGGGVSAEQAAVLSRFWKAQRMRVRESLLAQSRWEPSLRGLTWRVDLPTAASQGDKTVHSGPLALVELEVGQATQDSQFVCLEFDEVGVNDVLKKMANIQSSIERFVHHT